MSMPEPLKYLLANSITVFVFCPIALATAKDCYDDVFCIERLHGADGTVTLIATNYQAAEVVLSVSGSVVNGLTTGEFPLKVRLAGMERRELLSLRKRKVGNPWKYRYGVRWEWGESPVEHNNRHVYRLPFPSGQTFRVSQGFDGTFSHGGKYAVDFPMPVGSPVLAARKGKVVAVVDRHRKGGGRRYRKHTNFILVQHNDRTIGTYCHIAFQGARVRVGEQVEAGELIALSGNTGFSNGPHLHFHVSTPRTEKVMRTFPVQFYEASLGVVVPTKGSSLTAP